jgi:uncharacterized membrane protein
MNASQIHLALTHVPVILSIIGLIVLSISLAWKNDTLTKTSFYIFIAAGLFAIPVYLTGEGAEEIVEKFPGVSENIIEKHEEFAAISMVIILISGVISLAGLFLYKRLQIAKVLKYAVLLFAFGSAIMMAQTAHLGGQIRHTEIRSAFASAADSGSHENRNESKDSKKEEKDDDD